MSIMKIIGAVLLFFLIVSWIIYGFSPGHTWILFVVFVLIAMAVVPTKIKGLFALVILLLIAWFVFGGAGRSLEGIGNKIPAAVKDAAQKNIDNNAQGTVPGLLNQVTQAAQRLDQNDLNACLRVKAADAMKSNTGLSSKEAPCLSQTGVAFQICMKNNVFNGSVPGEVEDCEPSGIVKAGHLALATAYVAAKQAFGGICSATKFANSHVPGVSLPTSYCPPS
jgi:energy-coupling factor transporter transmembrane protein EcfT